MTRTHLFKLKNSMIFSNCVSNTIGVAVNMFFTRHWTETLSPEILSSVRIASLIFLPLSFFIPLLIALAYERPIRTFLNRKYRNQPMSEESIARARRTLLNEPFFLIAMDMTVWLIAAGLFSAIFKAHGLDWAFVAEVFNTNFFTGLVTVTIAFFVLEFILQRRIIRHFFPTGGISTTPNTYRIRIRTRLLALFLAINVIPLLAILGDASKMFPMAPESLQTLSDLQSSIYSQIVVFIGVGIWMIYLVSSNLTRSFKDIVHVLHEVKNGRFDSRVQVTTNDEIGYTGDAINDMTQGLMERDRLRHSLMLAKEIQQNLFPWQTIREGKLEIMGRSLYCDETGGDYFDYVSMGIPGEKKVAVVVGDVSGHGIPSALLMTTVRASLRQRLSRGGEAAEIVFDVNRQLAEDVAHSGDFVTLFFMIADIDSGHLQWVCAGHDPAILYDPESGDCRMLKGGGIALGIDADSCFTSHHLPGLTDGQVVLLGTDGIWETRNPEGELIGKDAICDVIRENADKDAERILDALFNTLESYRDGARMEDDITAVVMKINRRMQGS